MKYVQFCLEQPHIYFISAQNKKQNILVLKLEGRRQLGLDGMTLTDPIM